MFCRRNENTETNISNTNNLNVASSTSLQPSRVREDFRRMSTNHVSTKDTNPDSTTPKLAQKIDFAKEKTCFKRFTMCVGRIIAKCQTICKAKRKQAVGEKDLPPSESREALINWQPEREVFVCPTPSSTSSYPDSRDAEAVEEIHLRISPSRVAQWVDGQSIRSLHATIVQPTRGRGGMISDEEFCAVPVYSDTSIGSAEEDEAEVLPPKRPEDYSNWNALRAGKDVGPLTHFPVTLEELGETPIDQSLFANFECSNVVTDLKGVAEYWSASSSNSSASALFITTVADGRHKTYRREARHRNRFCVGAPPKFCEHEMDLRMMEHEGRRRHVMGWARTP
ncbi:hypothetical protein K458DRAFT_404548 [Lentithecium fluviatile CBS 122367]|uniref:Uncharacterized protein n=1 Tax=Lentithecium fluviatile CBS 122367 TaxID=1168545 RepID=A0A6G1IZL9_9PLEO|nr:hypothetical protein K458DRAFT_404548 [Lentithecium fluviatile CBS 122367]